MSSELPRQTLRTPEPIADGGIAVCGCSVYDSDDGVVCWRCEEVIGSRTIPAGVWRNMVERGTEALIASVGDPSLTPDDMREDAEATLRAALGISADA